MGINSNPPGGGPLGGCTDHGGANQFLAFRQLFFSLSKMRTHLLSVQILITKLHWFFVLKIFFYVVIGKCVALLVVSSGREYRKRAPPGGTKETTQIGR